MLLHFGYLKKSRTHTLVTKSPQKIILLTSIFAMAGTALRKISGKVGTMQSKYVIEFGLSGVSIPADVPDDPDDYSYKNVVNRKNTSKNGIDWLLGQSGAVVLASYEKLKENLISALILRDALPNVGPLQAPSTMVDGENPANWWALAQTIRTICNELGIFLSSYTSENSGALFVHLAPQPGSSASAQKSKKDLRGHTDAAVKPFPQETSSFGSESPSPDLVILACLRNPNSVATRVAPLSTIRKALPKDVFEKLQEPCYDFFPQSSFSTPDGHKLENVPILVRDHFEGFKIRFSHSKIHPSDPGDNLAAYALEVLKQTVATAYEDVILRTGDLLLVNNRTAIHGRGVVAGEIEVSMLDRWLMRAYGMHRNPGIYHDDDDHRSFVLR